ncbi:MAG: DNA cytosine methyltransferase [Acidimicrobiales bacterium]
MECAQQGPIAVDLFAGAGGLTLGLDRAGYQVVLAADHDPAAVETHLANFPGPCFDTDLSDAGRVDDLIGLLDGLDIDLIAGGPPCQPFSRAGRSKIRDLVDKGIREAIDPRRELWRVFLRVVEEVRPRAVLMENVPDMALGDDMRTVRYMADRLEAVGYETDMQILEAWRYGVPQHRQRLFFVALREGVFEWPKESDPVNLRQAIGDLPRLGDSTGSREMPYGRAGTDYQRRARAGVPSDQRRLVFDHMTRAVRPDDRQAFELMGQGLRYRDLPDELKRYRDDIFDDKYNRLSWSDRSRSITAHIAKDGYWYIHPEEHRTLTVREAARIQTFPDDFRFSGSRSDAFRLIGNAVPPLLGEVVANAIRSAIDRPCPAVDLKPSQIRSKVRALALEWAERGWTPAWRRTGAPWSVLVGTIAGRGRPDLADELLARYPDPDSAKPAGVAAFARRAIDDKARRVIEAVGRAARALRNDGWDAGTWAKAAGLGPADTLWVESVGLGHKHVAATTGIVRVAGRVSGEPDSGGVAGRMLLARLVGHSDSVPAVTAALAGLAAEVCLASRTICVSCPLASVCRSAMSPDHSVSSADDVQGSRIQRDQMSSATTSGSSCSQT